MKSGKGGGVVRPAPPAVSAAASTAAAVLLVQQALEKCVEEGMIKGSGGNSLSGGFDYASQSSGEVGGKQILEGLVADGEGI